MHCKTLQSTTAFLYSFKTDKNSRQSKIVLDTVYVVNKLKKQALPFLFYAP